MAHKLSKDETYRRILEAAVHLDLRRGHLRWTLSELARQSGVKRTLIYYYFGKDRAELIAQAALILGSEFFGFSPERLQLWKERQVEQAISATRERCQNNPEISIFYLLHRQQKSFLGQTFRALEKKYQDKLKQFVPGMTENQRQLAWAFIFGLVVAPNVDAQAIAEGAKVILRAGSER